MIGHFCCYWEKIGVVLKPVSVRLNFCAVQLSNKCEYSSSFSVVWFVVFSSWEFGHFCWCLLHTKDQDHWFSILRSSAIHYGEIQRARKQFSAVWTITWKEKSTTNSHAQMRPHRNNTKINEDSSAEHFQL